MPESSAADPGKTSASRTPAPRAFRFGVQCALAPSRQAWQDKARRVEALGYHVFVVPDHFGPQLAPVPALLSAAEATRSIRIGSLVFDNDFRHPAMLAKEVATLDLLSDGRFELGLGAGWLKTEYDQAGIEFAPGATRVARMIESVALLRAIFRGGPTTHAGAHYAIRELDCPPVPVQRPCPPLLIGGGGPRMLRFAAREADIIGIVPRSLPQGGLDLDDSSPEAFHEKISWIRDAAGSRLADIELNTLLQAIAITDDRDATAAQLAGPFGVEPKTLLESPLVLIGSPSQIEETLLARRETFGLSYYSLFEPHMEAFAPIAARLAGR